jgi:hypothetical protein
VREDEFVRLDGNLQDNRQKTCQNIPGVLMAKHSFKKIVIFSVNLHPHTLSILQSIYNYLPHSHRFPEWQLLFQYAVIVIISGIPVKEEARKEDVNH